MEQIELELSGFTLRSRSVGVSHTAAGLSRGLEPGEPVVVNDPTSGLFYAAMVADIDFSLDDTTYRIEIGSRLAPEEAEDWLAPDPLHGEDELTVHDLMKLLGELRQSRRVLQALEDDVAR
ncbi:hypothetical protein F0U44_15660 [Nocardioides humilatus]|uniref:Uncharacterized protein n=1 Tax=Nocardioides humilatus TaxID=2607660 RepID=A0A5B1LBU9_9ACTN|nr:hypothetical protein [Nocardioides humilatus]KAA1417728.1 hypothetical protein F0U44_15660 [Nocardioides humilatus]